MTITPKTFDKVIEGGLFFIIFFTPFAFGSTQVWAYTLIELVVIFLIATWLIKLNLKNRNKESKKHEVHPAILIPISLFIFLILFQMLPLPPQFIKHLSPNTYKLYEQTLPNWPALKDASLENQGSGFNHNWKSISIHRHATKTELFKILAYIGVFFLIIYNPTNKNQIRRLILAIILVGCFEAFYGLLEYLSGHQHIFFFKKKYYTDSVTGTYINRNHFAGYLEMVIPIAFGLLIYQSNIHRFYSTGSWRHRLSGIESYLSKNGILIFGAIIMILALVFSQSRMGIISLLSSMGFMGFMLLISSKRRRKRIVIFILILALISIFFLTWIGLNPVFERFTFIPQELESESSRPIVWKDTINLIKDFPISGTGLGTYIHIFPRYKTISTRILYDHAHNDYLEFFSEVGIVGVFIMLAGFGLFIIRIFRRWKERRDPYVKGLTLGGLTGVIAILIHSITDFNLHIPANALLLAIILGLTFNVVNLKRIRKDHA
jgi:O-antigen ligase